MSKIVHTPVDETALVEKAPKYARTVNYATLGAGFHGGGSILESILDKLAPVFRIAEIPLGMIGNFPIDNISIVSWREIGIE